MVKNKYLEMTLRKWDGRRAWKACETELKLNTIGTRSGVFQWVLWMGISCGYCQAHLFKHGNRADCRKCELKKGKQCANHIELLPESAYLKQAYNAWMSNDRPAFLEACRKFRAYCRAHPPKVTV